jgi:predicted DNA-binding protein (MmcQ/YjbR family)
VRNGSVRSLTWAGIGERVKGIEPSLSAWEADVLPLNYTRSDVPVSLPAPYAARVPHPRMYDEDDPLLADLREVCLALPEATEVESWGRPTFRAGAKGRMFAVYGAEGLIFKPDPAERDALLAGGTCIVPPYFGPGGWLALALGEPDWTEIAELVETSYRQVALKRQVKEL